jgi:hypothetical protein
LPDRLIEGHRNIVEQARKHPGCLDLAISPDPTEAGRVNIFEYWESKDTLDTWRATGGGAKHALTHSICPCPIFTCLSGLLRGIDLYIDMIR